MILPGADRARVDLEKVADYLLDLSHSDGAGKARFFLRFGFTPERPEELILALKEHAISQPVTQSVESPYGMRYTLIGPVGTPDGRKPINSSVWIIENGVESPRLITAYPS